MSTILKALKRIDQTSPPPDALQAWPPKINTQKSVKARVHKIWLYRKVYRAIILIVMVIVAGWFAYSQKQWLASKILPQKISANRPIYQGKIYPASDESKRTVPEKEATLKRQNARSGTSVSPRPAGVDLPSPRVPQTPTPQKRQTNKIFASSGKTEPPEANITAKSNTPRSSPTAGSGKSVPRETRPAAAALAKKSPSQVARTYKRLDDSKLNLQAIAWSRDAKQRIAVINGHIVREGEYVDGFLVNQIRQEDVVVNDGAASWQIEFGLK